MKFDIRSISSRIRGLFIKTPEQNQKPVVNYERDFHKLTFSELCQRLSTSVTDGLDDAKAKSFLITYGKNKITQKRKNPVLKVIGYFFTGFCPLIFIAAIVCILAWQPIGSVGGNQPQVINLALGILLLIVIFIQAGFTAFQDWSSSKVMNSIKNMMPTETIVIRDGMEKKIHVEELVIGDLVLLIYGSKVPADIRLVETHDLKFDKSMVKILFLFEKN
jgi:sodium/potassium-transporting ATPase subunit alpha